MGLDTLQPGPVRELGTFEMFCSIEKIWEIEVGNVVAYDDIWIDLLKKVSPCHEHLVLCTKFENLRVDNQTASIETKNITNEGFRFSVSCYDVRDLDDGILIGFWEDAFAASTLNIEGKDSQWSHLRPFAVVMVSY